MRADRDAALLHGQITVSVCVPYGGLYPGAAALPLETRRQRTTGSPYGDELQPNLIISSRTQKRLADDQQAHHNKL